MTAVLGSGPRYVTLRRVPSPGEPGCVGACPLCTVPGKSNPPCLACRDELRARLAEFNMASFVEGAVN